MISFVDVLFAVFSAFRSVFFFRFCFLMDFTINSLLIYGDKVAQLVRCRTSNQRVAGSIPGQGTWVCPWTRQFIPYCLSLPSCKMGT